MRSFKWLGIVFLITISLFGTFKLGQYHQEIIGNIKIIRLHNRILEGSLEVDGATGTMIFWDKVKHVGYILTAYHVIAEQHKTKSPVTIAWRYWNDKTRYGTSGKVYAVDETNDLALLEVTIELPVFEIASDEEYAAIKPGHLTMSSGYPVHDLSGLMISTGYVVDTEFEWETFGKTLFHRTTGWYGHSGGAIINIKTGHVIGIESQFGPGGHSSSAVAISAPAINRFLRKTGLTN